MLSLNLKIVLAGDYAVGKTSLVQRYATNAFRDEYKPTLGFDVLIKHLVVNGRPVSLSIWDLGAGMGFKHLRSNYIRECRGCLIVCDLTRRDTFEDIESWLAEIKAVAANAPLVLVGNKSDLPNQAITGADIAQKADAIGAVGGITTSAKEGSRVDDAFLMLVHKIVRLAELSPDQY